MEPELFTPKEVMAKLKLGRSKVYSLISTRQLRSVRIGKKILIRAPDIEEFLQQHSQ